MWFTDFYTSSSLKIRNSSTLRPKHRALDPTFWRHTKVGKCGCTYTQRKEGDSEMSERQRDTERQRQRDHHGMQDECREQCCLRM